MIIYDQHILCVRREEKKSRFHCLIQFVRSIMAGIFWQRSYKSLASCVPFVELITGCRRKLISLMKSRFTTLSQLIFIMLIVISRKSRKFVKIY